MIYDTGLGSQDFPSLYEFFAELLRPFPPFVGAVGAPINLSALPTWGVSLSLSFSLSLRTCPSDLAMWCPGIEFLLLFLYNWLYDVERPRSIP